MDKADEECLEQVGCPHVRHGWCVFLIMLRRRCCLLLLLLPPLLTVLPDTSLFLSSPILSILLDKVLLPSLDEVNEDDCLSLSSLSEALAVDDFFANQLPILLPKRRRRLPSNFTFPIVMPAPPSLLLVASLLFGVDLGGSGGLVFSLCTASR